MRFIRTVRGDIPPAELGPTDAHEHLFFVTPIQPGDEYSDVDLAVAEARSLAVAGARALVDWTPIGLGRDVAGLREVAERAGLHVVCATGIHRDAHYSPDDRLRAASVSDLAQRFVGDVNDAAGPSGVIKIGASYQHITPFERCAFEAAALAHAETRVPICVHTEHGTMGLEIVEALGRLGVAPTSIVLAHLDRNPDAGMHTEIGCTGAWLAYDGPGRAKYWPDSTIIALVEALAANGLAGRLLVGGDTGRRSMMRSYGGGPGADYMFRRFKPRLERELGSELSQLIFVTNPARAFSFSPSGPTIPFATPRPRPT